MERVDLSYEDSVRLKAECVERLRGVDLGGHGLGEADGRCVEYARGVVGDPDGHNLFELLAVERFYRLCDLYRFDAVRVRRFIRFCEVVPLPRDVGFKPAELTPVECFMFANAFGLYRADGRRLVTDVLWFVPRKFGKTTLIALCAIFDFLFGDANAEVYTASNTTTQAGICFNIVRNTLRNVDGDTLLKTNRREIYFKGNDLVGRTAKISCLSSDAGDKDGFNSSLNIIDELAASPDLSLYTTLRSGTGARRNPMTMIITTASTDPDAPFVDILESYKRILLREREDDRVSAWLFCPDVGDDVDDVSVWRKVQPHLGVTVQEDYYEDWCRKSEESAEMMTEYQTKLLNVFVRQAEGRAWLSAEEVDARSRRGVWGEMVGRSRREDLECMVGVDLSDLGDFTCASFLVWHRGDQLWYMKTLFYIPSKVLEGHPNRKLYRRWIEEGWLEVTESKTVDYGRVVDDIERMDDEVRVIQVGIDPNKARDFVNIMAVRGYDGALVYVPQSVGKFSCGTDTFEKYFREEMIVFEYNPIFSWCVGNAVIFEDNCQNRKPMKGSNGALKIDGAITACEAFWLEVNYTG